MASRAVNPLERSLRSACSELTDLGRRFAVVGGLAVSTWAEPRLTCVADVAVAVAGVPAARRASLAIHEAKSLALRL